MVRGNAIKMLKGDHSSPYEFRIITKDGQVRWLMARMAPIHYRGKRAALGNWMDVTERKRVEEALRESEQRLRTMLHGSPIPIFIVDKDHRVIYWNKALEEYSGVKAEEVTGTDQHWRAFYTEKRPCMAALLVDKATEEIPQWYPGRCSKSELVEEAYEATDFFPALGQEGEWLRFTAAAIRDSRGNLLAVMETLEDITEHKKAEEQLKHSFIDLAETISRAIGSRDPYTSEHQRRVAELARLIGEKMGLDEDSLQGLYIGGLLHDIGKISMPESVLTKPGKLTEEEWSLIRAHAKRGYAILKDTELPWPVAEMALHHHERLDGSGYPHGISGDKLSLENRILGVCDVVEAMSSHRPYRPARSKKEVLEEIKSGRGTKYDANVVDIMLEIIKSGEFKI